MMQRMNGPEAWCRIALFWGAALTAAVSGVAVAGCGSEGGDDSADAQAADAALDRTASDGNQAGDGAMSQDATLGDAGDGGLTSDARDAAADAPALGAFAGAYAEAFCARLESCCGALDAGAGFDRTTCRQVYRFGWEDLFRSATTPGVTDAGNLRYDSNRAAECLARAGNFSCPVVTAQEYKATTEACLGVVEGTLSTGTNGCLDHVECAPGHFCEFFDAGSDSGPKTGACRALREAGAGCADYPVGEACSYLGSGATCDQNDPDAGASCVPLRANGDPCVFNTECASGLCNDVAQCGGTLTVVGPGLCANFIKDAGTD